MKVITVATASDPIIALAVGLSRFAGLTSPELLTMRWKQVDLLRKVIRVLVTKSGSRTCPVMMSPELVALFRELPAGKPDDFIFPMSLEQYRRRLAIVRELAGIPAWGKGGLRMAYRISSKWTALDPKLAASLLGHSSGSVDLSQFYKTKDEQA